MSDLIEAVLADEEYQRRADELGRTRKRYEEACAYYNATDERVWRLRARRLEIEVQAKQRELTALVERINRRLRGREWN